MHYFHQWQRLPVDPDRWQCIPGQPHHPAVADLADQADGSVLNVGCGAARDRGLYRCRYLGVDVTPKFVRAAHRRGVDVICASALSLPFRDDAFRTVYCKDVMVHLPPGAWKRMLREMWRVASRRAVTVEGSWWPTTRYVQGERYLVDGEPLRFWNNAYGREEVLAFAARHGVDAPVVIDGDGWQASYYLLGDAR